MNKNSIVPIILSGGSGTRLWPLSRESFPKQYISIAEDKKKSMVQTTYERLIGIQDLENPILICNEDHRFIIAEQFREINIKPKSILLEPFGKNTAPAIALAAFKALETGDDPILLILSSDHYIKSSSVFRRTIKKGIEYSQKNRLVTFGIVPKSPDTGYGYIKVKDAIKISSDKGYEIEKFIEKPSLEEAKKLLKNKQYFWNSGIFLFKASVILEQIKKFNPEIVELCKKSLEKNIIDLDFQRIDEKHFKQCPNISIDICVMEKTNLGTVLPLKTDWSDLGNWNSVWLNRQKDKDGNAIEGRVLLKKSKNCYLRSEGRLIVGLGLENIIAVETCDAILISNKLNTQEIKDIVRELKNNKLVEGKEHKISYRPWGNYTSIAENKYWKVKKLIVNPKQSLSLQSHNFRSEHWVVVSGEAKVTLDYKDFYLKKNESIYVPSKTKHKLSNESEEILVLIEVQSGSYLGEDDIKRFEDIYGRINKQY